MSRGRLPVVLVLVLGLAAATGETRGGDRAAAPRLAVLDPAGRVDADARTRLADELAAALSELGLFAVVPRAETRAFLAAAGLDGDPCRDAVCLGRIAAGLDAAQVVAGDVRRTSGRWSCDLRLVAVADGGVSIQRLVSHRFAETEIAAGVRVLAHLLAGLPAPAPAPDPAPAEAAVAEGEVVGREPAEMETPGAVARSEERQPVPESPVAPEDGVHPHLLAPLSADGPFPRFTPAELRRSGFPDHLHAWAWPDWQPPRDDAGRPYGPGTLCGPGGLADSPELATRPGEIRWRNLVLTFDPRYQICDMMIFAELCDLGRVWCRDLLGIAARDTLHVVNPDNRDDYAAETGYGIWRTYRLEGDRCVVQPIPTLMARTLIGHTAVDLVTLWTVREVTGGRLPAWFERGLALYLADMGLHLNNFMDEFRPRGDILLPPERVEAILREGVQPADDRQLYRRACYGAFLMAWRLVEDGGGLEPVRRLLAAVEGGADPDAACREIYGDDWTGLARRLDPAVVGEPHGGVSFRIAPHKPPR